MTLRLAHTVMSASSALTSDKTAMWGRPPRCIRLSERRPCRSAPNCFRGRARATHVLFALATDGSGFGVEGSCERRSALAAAVAGRRAAAAGVWAPSERATAAVNHTRRVLRASQRPHVFGAERIHRHDSPRICCPRADAVAGACFLRPGLGNDRAHSDYRRHAGAQ